jgi:chromatin structure-remodeling complex protein RSC7
MARGRPSRAAAVAAAQRSTPARSATPQEDSEDEEMVDAPESRADTPPVEEDAGTPAQDSDEEKPHSEPSSPPVIQSFPRKKRLGRPPKNRPPDWNAVDPENSEGGTPVKRKRGRPSLNTPRGRAGRGGASHSNRVAIDKEGTMMDVVDDELDLPEDAEGEKKVDKLGNLLGGRDYRVRVFKIGGRGDRLYMLSTEPARCTGFRDSYLFFTKHMRLHKIIIDDNEKRDLIDREIIPHSYKGRAIGVVTARSVFREFGARIIIGGKKVIDDYYETAARENGAVEGELATPDDRLPPPGEPYNKNQYVAWHGASSVYHTGAPSVPLANGKPVPGKRKVNITSANWQFEHARSSRYVTQSIRSISLLTRCSRFNSNLSQLRKANMLGTYDPHTNMVCYPKTTQPTHARWEEVLSTETDVPEVVRQHYLVIDTYVQKPPFGGLGIPGPDGDFYDVGPNGLPEVDEEDLEQMTAESREAFLQAKREEYEWRNTWQSESIDGARAKLKIPFTGVPV